MSAVCDSPKLVLNVTPTEHFFMAGDVMVRMWQGVGLHPNGVSEPVIALVSAVAFTDQADALVSATGLVSIPPPTPEDAERWARKLLDEIKPSG